MPQIEGFNTNEDKSMSKSTAPTPPAAPLANSTSGKPMFFGPETAAWKELKPDVLAGTDPDEEQKIVAAAKAAKEELKNFLLSSLQMQHVVVLAGSGTSLDQLPKVLLCGIYGITVCIQILMTTYVT